MDIAVVFGAGRPQTGCLILPSDLGKDLSSAELMEEIWPVIEQANSEAPTHSRLLPEMIEFLPYVLSTHYFILFHAHGFTKVWYTFTCSHEDVDFKACMLRNI